MGKERVTKIALAQMKMTEDWQENVNKSLSLLRQAGQQNVDVIVYPEVQMSPFFAQFRHTHPKVIDIDDPIFRQFGELCKQYQIMACPNFYFKEHNQTYDASFLIDKEGKIVGCQKMVHIAQAHQFYEQDYYAPANDGFHVFGDMGIVVCFDRHYPESIRTEALRGAKLILIPTANTKMEPMELFEQEIRVQAFQNCCFLAMCNRTGKEYEMNFAGESLVCDPDGNTIAKAGYEEELLIVDIDLDKAKQARQSRPYLNLRRTEWYE